MIKALLEKIKESLMAVVPITIVVLILCCIFPVSGWTIFAFLIGAIMLIFGLSFFNLGADSSMMKMGEQIGQFVTKKKNIWMLIGVTVAIGLIITIAEPDLMVLAEQMQHTIPKVLLIVMVALGVGVFLALALVRIVLQIKLNVMLIILYLIVFLIAIFVPNEFIAVAFDSGGVTTGPMTVPFILALGLGVAGARGSNASKDDSFGLVSFCSIGPVLMVLILGLFFKNPNVDSSDVISFHTFSEFSSYFGKQLLKMMGEIGLAILPILACIIIFKCILIKDNKKNILKIMKIFVIGIIVLALALLYKGGNILSSNKLSRLNFKAPCTRYQEESGYQVCNALIAISNGGLFGVGLGQSSQKYLYLPESHTDMIFPIICEELGSIVGALTILLYGVILYKIFKIAKRSDNLRTSILAYGTFWYFTLHIFINLFGLLAVIPLTGVPLPFLSYGGSYTLNAIFLIFVTERVAIENKKNKLKREIMSI